MAKAKNKITSGTILDIFKHFGTQPDNVRRPFIKSAGIRASDIKTAASSGSTPTQGRRKIVTAAKAHGWEGP